MAALAISCLTAGQENCSDVPGSDKFLSGEVSPGSAENPTIVLFPCDTVIVAEGVGYSVGRNTYLSFLDPKPSNTIIVLGVMKIAGNPDAIVHLSSSLDTASLNALSMKVPWRGIRVDGEGLLILENASLYGARIPVRSQSENINIKNTHFYDADHLSLPNQTKYPFQTTYYIELFKYREYSKRQAAKSRQSPVSRREDYQRQALASKRKSFWEKPWTWVGLGTAVLGGLAVYWMATAEAPPPNDIYVPGEL